jgi:oligopeptide transport system ATP-binding protein
VEGTWGYAEKLFDHPLHPYTLALLSSVPAPDRPKDLKTQELRGDVPSPFNPPPGCKFQGRCPLVEERCRKGEIEFWQDLRTGHTPLSHSGSENDGGAQRD